MNPAILQADINIRELSADQGFIFPHIPAMNIAYIVQLTCAVIQDQIRLREYTLNCLRLCAAKALGAAQDQPDMPVCLFFRLTLPLIHLL